MMYYQRLQFPLRFNYERIELAIVCAREYVCWCRMNIVAQKWKINYGKVQVIPFVVNPNSEIFIVDISS